MLLTYPPIITLLGKGYNIVDLFILSVVQISGQIKFGSHFVIKFDKSEDIFEAPGKQGTT